MKTTGNRTLDTSKDNVPDARPLNWYVTPWGVVDVAYQTLTEHIYSLSTIMLDLSTQFRILDVCAGTGRWGRLFGDYFNALTGLGRIKEVVVDAVDMDASFAEMNAIFDTFYVSDLTTDDWTMVEEQYGSYDLIVGNPAFDLLHRGNYEIFMEKMYRLLRPRGILIMLTPNSTMFSQTRNRQYGHPTFPITHIQILSRRVSFNPLFHPQQGQGGAGDHVIMFYRKGGQEKLATITANQNDITYDYPVIPDAEMLADSPVRPDEYELLFPYQEDTFLHQLAHGLWDFEFVERDAKGKVIRTDGKTTSVDLLDCGWGIIMKDADGYNVRSPDWNEGFRIERNQIPTIPKWVWDSVLPD